MKDSPIGRALDLLVADDPAGALRWSLAIVERDPPAPHALFVASRALARIGSARVAKDGLMVAARRAAEAGDLPIAIAAIADLRASGSDVRGLADEIAATVCRDENLSGPAAIAFAGQTRARPLSSLLGPRALIARATQMIYEAASAEPRRRSSLAFFGRLPREAARDLVLCFETSVVPPGHCLIDEGETPECGFVLAAGGAEIFRRSGEPDGRRSLAHLESGAFFGELALLVRLPSHASVATTCASVVLVAWRDAFEALCAKHAEVRLELGAHCKRQAAANLGSSLTVLDAVPHHERAALVERIDLRTFERGARLANLSEEAEGLHVIVSGEALLVARDGAERVVVQTLAPGDTVGETELVLCRTANTEAVAVTDVATLFLPRDEFFSLSREYPAMLQGVYTVASRRSSVTSEALDTRPSVPVGDDCVVEEQPPAERPPRPDDSWVSSARPGTEPLREAEPQANQAQYGGTTPAAAAPTAPRSQVPPPLSAIATPVPGAPPSTAPATLSQKPSAPAGVRWRTALSPRSVRATAVIALATGVCAVLTPRGDRITPTVGPATHDAVVPPEDPASAAASPFPATSAEANAMTSGGRLAKTPPAPGPFASATPTLPRAYGPSPVAKRRPTASGAPTTGAPESTPVPTASALPSARPASRSDEADFGGRE